MALLTVVALDDFQNFRRTGRAPGCMGPTVHSRGKFAVESAVGVHFPGRGRTWSNWRLSLQYPLARFADRQNLHDSVQVLDASRARRDRAGGAVAVPGLRIPALAIGAEDRKSTRLN